MIQVYKLSLKLTDETISRYFKEKGIDIANIIPCILVNSAVHCRIRIKTLQMLQGEVLDKSKGEL